MSYNHADTMQRLHNFSTLISGPTYLLQTLIFGIELQTPLHFTLVKNWDGQLQHVT